MLGSIFMAVLSVSVAIGHASSLVDVVFSTDGLSYLIQMSGATWFESGPTSATFGGVTYSSADGTLKLKHIEHASTSHSVLGSGTSTTQTWSAGRFSQHILCCLSITQ